MSSNRKIHGSTLFDMSCVQQLNENDLEELYRWVDQISLSRPKKNMTRDFSDAVLAAEIIHHFFPKYVDMHNYCSTMSAKFKEQNWYLLNRKVLSRLGIELHSDVLHALANCRPLVIENVLLFIRQHVYQHQSSDSDTRTANDVRMVSQLPGNPNSNFRNTGDVQLVSQLPGNSKSNAVLQQRPTNDTPYTVTTKRSQHRTGEVGSRTDDVPLVPHNQLEESEQALQSSSKTIELLQSKLEKLEHLLYLKNLRIDDLTSRLATLTDEVPAEPKRQSVNSRATAGSRKRSSTTAQQYKTCRQ